LPKTVVCGVLQAVMRRKVIDSKAMTCDFSALAIFIEVGFCFIEVGFLIFLRFN
jgi:hypothetical protein